MNKTTKQILIEARDALAADNFKALTECDLVDFVPNADGSVTPCYCALGHIAIASGYIAQRDKLWRNGERGYAIDSMYEVLEEMPAVKALAESINRYSDSDYNYTVYKFNDDNCRDHPERIVKAFDRAIESFGY